VRKSEKADVIAALTETVQRHGSVVLTDYRGLTVKDITDLRIALAKLGATVRVVKNTLFQRSLAKDQEGLAPYLKGPVAATFISADYGPVLKEIARFARTHPQLAFKGSWIDSRAFGPEDTAALATLPPREHLLGMLVSVLSSPLSGLVGTLQAVPRDLMLTLMSLAEQRGAAGATA
jgi:large subunit ribosomal protein L10